MLKEEEYINQAINQKNDMTYEEYVESYNNKKVESINNMKVTGYGLENNIPSLEDTKDARAILDSTYEIYIMISILIVIIIGGGIVASEFSKGTIRLLLIRPVLRGKVLMSKLITVLLMGILVVLIGIGTLYISTGFIYGFESYQVPLLEIVNNEIVNISFAKTLIQKTVISSSSIVFISSFVFMISTLSKNIALAVAGGMIVYLIPTMGTDLLISNGMTGLVNTFIPYINSSYLRMMSTTPEFIDYTFGMQMKYTSGAIQLIIMSILISIITFVVFIKKDIKN